MTDSVKQEAPLSASRLEEKRLHLDEGEVVEARQTLVADAAKFIPKERPESVLSGGPVHRLRAEVSSHLEICHLDGEQQTNDRKSEQN